MNRYFTLLRKIVSTQKWSRGSLLVTGSCFSFNQIFYPFLVRTFHLSVLFLMISLSSSLHFLTLSCWLSCSYAHFCLSCTPSVETCALLLSAPISPSFPVFSWKVERYAGKVNGTCNERIEVHLKLMIYLTVEQCARERGKEGNKER